MSTLKPVESIPQSQSFEAVIGPNDQTISVNVTKREDDGQGFGKGFSKMLFTYEGTDRNPKMIVEVPTTKGPANQIVLKPTDNEAFKIDAPRMRMFVIDPEVNETLRPMITVGDTHLIINTNIDNNNQPRLSFVSSVNAERPFDQGLVQVNFDDPIISIGSRAVSKVYLRKPDQNISSNHATLTFRTIKDPITGENVRVIFVADHSIAGTKLCYVTKDEAAALKAGTLVPPRR